jgi:hypothetical protein
MTLPDQLPNLLLRWIARPREKSCAQQMVWRVSPHSRLVSVAYEISVTCSNVSHSQVVPLSMEIQRICKVTKARANTLI